MRTIILALITGILIISCGTEPTSTIDGNYKGVYSITHNYGTDSAYTLRGNITFEFSKGQYKYEGEKLHLPPGGLGEYIVVVETSKIILVDYGRYKANIDPRLLLNGSFDYSFNGENLTLTQEAKQYSYFHKIVLNKQRDENNN